tara:strand:+ start:325 stop:501 length:177 start_codon:yes stop_codon:yes gene_type:complete
MGGAVVMMVVAVPAVLVTPAALVFQESANPFIRTAASWMNLWVMGRAVPVALVALCVR